MSPFEEDEGSIIEHVAEAIQLAKETGTSVGIFRDDLGNVHGESLDEVSYQSLRCSIALHVIAGFNQILLLMSGADAGSESEVLVFYYCDSGAVSLKIDLDSFKMEKSHSKGGWITNLIKCRKNYALQ